MTARNPNLEASLKDLELAVARGRLALELRNELLVQMSQDGYSNTDLYTLVNRARIDADLLPITRFAIDKVISRRRPKPED